MKKFIAAFFVLGGFAQAEVMGPVVRDAFIGDSETMFAGWRVGARLQELLPGCTLHESNEVVGHLLSATNNTTVNPDLRFRTYLASRHYTCAKDFTPGAITLRRSVTAKVSTSIEKDFLGNWVEVPRRVIVVDIVNDED